MKNKFAILIIIVSFLIGEVSLLIFKQTFIEDVVGNKNPAVPSEQNFSSALRALKGEKLVLSWSQEHKSYINISDLLTRYRRNYSNSENLRLNFEKIEESLISLAPAINQNPVDARLEFSEEEKRLKEFSLPQNGKKLNIGKTMAQIASNLAHRKLETELVIDEVAPEININNIEKLGITTLLGRGESDFEGSPSNRTHNIKTGAAKFHGLLVRPGEEFSFNSALGDVDAKNSYLSELVIKNGKLVREYGGGICQVSTTLFRAAFLAGLPITERRGHSLPVRYYNPQGFDATIYPNVIDLKFKNDTGNNILIQSKIEGTKIAFELYGSSDGRKVESDGPKITEQKEDGSLKTILARKIFAADGEVKEEYFKSTYKSPSLFPLEKNPLE